MELTSSESAQCPAPTPTDPARCEVLFLLHKLGQCPRLQAPPPMHTACLQTNACPTPSLPSPKLLPDPASPWGCPHLCLLSSVRLPICLHFFASRLLLNLVSVPSHHRSAPTEHTNGLWPPNPPGALWTWHRTVWGFLPSFLLRPHSVPSHISLPGNSSSPSYTWFMFPPRSFPWTPRFICVPLLRPSQERHPHLIIYHTLKVSPGGQNQVSCTCVLPGPSPESTVT